jgi:hypothetical protein
MHSDKAKNAPGFIAVANKLLTEEGVLAFYKGMLSKIIYTILNAGFVMAT